MALPVEKDAQRSKEIRDFLQEHIAGPFERLPLAGDASFRRYERIHLADGSCQVLMDAPPPEKIGPFADITRWLQQEGLSAPVIYAENDAAGLLLLEDLGDRLYAAHVSTHPQEEERLYRRAMQILIELAHYQSPPPVGQYDSEAYLREVEIFADWFLPEIDAGLKAEWMKLWQQLLQRIQLQCNTPVLRDYHAENLIWLPEREDVRQVGLLDYQDALMGDAAYDVVSLLEDARRDVSRDTAHAMLRYYLEQTGQNAADFQMRYALLGAQRNSKIIGVFHRLHRRDGKAKYLEHLPRVWHHLALDVQHPALKPLKDWLFRHMPEKLSY